MKLLHHALLEKTDFNAKMAVFQLDTMEVVNVYVKLATQETTAKLPLNVQLEQMAIYVRIAVKPLDQDQLPIANVYAQHNSMEQIVKSQLRALLLRYLVKMEALRLGLLVHVLALAYLVSLEHNAKP